MRYLYVALILAFAAAGCNPSGNTPTPDNTPVKNEKDVTPPKTDETKPDTVKTGEPPAKTDVTVPGKGKDDKGAKPDTGAVPKEGDSAGK